MAPVLAVGRAGYFYPRSPCGERRRRSVKLFRQNYISIHALLAESDVTRVASTPTTVISIHALLAESDIACHLVLDGLNLLISIHALLAESDQKLCMT